MAQQRQDSTLYSKIESDLVQMRCMIYVKEDTGQEHRIKALSWFLGGLAHVIQAMKAKV